ncbi:MAG: hypothetical protein LBE56_10895 [Tannerella sp.]|jgi:hypothetical protein|nr:hypothetical protein [Tannerella sp.]
MNIKIIKATTNCFLCLLVIIAFSCDDNYDIPSSIIDEIASLECIANTSDAPSRPSLGGGDCELYSFLEGVAKTKCKSNRFLIKGRVTGAYEYGLTIKLIEDLKGNFPENNNNTFTVWGSNGRTDRVDRLDIGYDEQEMLIMLVMPAVGRSEDWDPDYIWLEQSGDYATMTCQFSVVVLQGDQVTGYLLPRDNDGVRRERTISLKDFNNIINKILK